MLETWGGREAGKGRSAEGRKREAGVGAEAASGERAALSAYMDNHARTHPAPECQRLQLRPKLLKAHPDAYVKAYHDRART